MPKGKRESGGRTERKVLQQQALELLKANKGITADEAVPLVAVELSVTEATARELVRMIGGYELLKKQREVVVPWKKQ